MQLISYTIKPDLIEQNRSMIAGVFETLHRSLPADLRYTVLETGDGRFLHLAESTESSSHALQTLPAFRTFVSGLEERQQTPTIITELRIVGTYGRLIGQ
jgi:hypothetical protein